MRFFADSRTKRHTALVVLLAWLFALASSVANACFLETGQPHLRAAEKSADATLRAPAGLHAHSATDAGHHDNPDGTKESCLKVCDDGTHTLPKACSGVDHSNPGPALVVATLWTAASNVVSAPRRPDAPTVPILGPPLRVRYSRLAL